MKLEGTSELSKSGWVPRGKKSGEEGIMQRQGESFSRYLGKFH